MAKHKSPCTDTCDFSGPKRWCLGCGRTRQECREWKGMKPFKKTNLEKELKQRMAKMKSKP